jgi:probable HAF family extracellular repeat protein
LKFRDQAAHWRQRDERFSRSLRLIYRQPAVCCKGEKEQMRILTKQIAFMLILAASLAFSGGGKAAKHSAVYSVSELASIGGTISRGNSINNDGWVSGFSFTAGNSRRHAALWINGAAPIDLGTLAGPDGYSSVVWPVNNNSGIIAGISQTSIVDPNHENWSCSPFLYGVFTNITGNTCVGFVWQNGEMRPLPTLGGYNGFAAGANNRGQVTGWTENTIHDPTCLAPQVLQFRPVIWGPAVDQITELPLFPGDTSGSATAINDRGQAVGISGVCDQAVGRYSAAHAVLWENGKVSEIVGDNGGPYWDTPMAINNRGDVVGFVGIDGDVNANLLRAFRWTKQGGFQYLLPLDGDPFSEALGINNRGQVVGISCAFGGAPCIAVLWESDSVTATNLNTIVPGYTGLLTTAQDINDAGQITGRANAASGQRVTYVATLVEGN